jgi:alpha-beta hydrolase superfamily lysophospholipase
MMEERRKEQEEKNVANEIVIVGHSMGTKAALLTAWECCMNEKLGLHPSLIVLVAPALEGLTLPRRRRKKPMAEIPTKLSGVRRKLAYFWIVWRKLFVDYPFRYILRRLVG